MITTAPALPAPSHLNWKTTMGPALYLGFAILLSMFLAWLAVRLMNRSAAARGTGWPSPLVAILSLGSWGFLSFAAIFLAYTTTTRFRAAIIVGNMEARSPFRAIAAHDRVERDRLRAAVVEGLDSGASDLRSSVGGAVSRELVPYLSRRIASAPDPIFRDLARIVADAESDADMMGSCRVPQDRTIDTLIHRLDARRITEWTDRLIAAPARRDAGPLTPAQEAEQKRDLVTRTIAAGTSPASANAAVTPDAADPRRCRAAADMIRSALADPDRTRGDRDLRVLLSGFRFIG